MPITAREIHLKRRPARMPALDDFETAERALDAPGERQILVRNLYISVDPYMRGRMTDRESYIPPFQLGHPMEGAAVGVIEQSGHAGFQAGDLVSHFAGWRDYALIDAATAVHIDDSQVPARAYLGTLGFPGLSAYVGLTRIAEAKAGDTVFVSAGSGAVGTVACQIARIRGCRVVATVGSDEKARWLKEEIGVDAVINYRTAGDLARALAEAAPEGIDVYFDNVGGAHLEAALAAANRGARFVLCGMIAQYNDGTPPPGPRNIFLAVEKRLTLRGFIVSDHVELFPEFVREMTGWITEGRMKWRETVVEGLDAAPGAFLGLFRGDNVGKMLVKVGDR